MKKERIDKLISSQSMMTRTEASKLIRSGSVKVNNAVIKDTGFKVSPDNDMIEVDGVAFRYKKYIYIMMNKPSGVVSASRDPSERTVVDLLPDNLLRPNLFPAGRLDKDTLGFVLITDDGDFAHDILSPKHHIEKTYLAKLDSRLSEESKNLMENGMTIGDELLMPAKVSLFEDGEHPVYKIVICQGKYHQIKRMIASCGRELLELKRIKMGNLDLDASLAPGEARELTEEETEMIKCRK